MLTAPASVIYAWAKLGSRSWPEAVSASLGGLAYLALGVMLGLVQAVLSGRERTSDPMLGLLGVAQAPAAVLLPAMFGLRDLDLRMSSTWEVVLTALFVLGVLAAAWKSRDRAPILAGLALILGAYLLIYPFRSVGGTEPMFRIARYHLFPQFGLALLVGSALRRWLSGPRGAWLATIVIASLLAVHLPRMVAEVKLYNFPNQAHTLAALEHVRAICLNEGINREQVLSAFEPIRPHWMPFDRKGANVLRLLDPIPQESRVPDSEVRGRLLASLNATDKEGLFGEMDVAPYLVPASTLEGWKAPLALGRMDGMLGMKTTDQPGVYESAGWPSYVEFALDAPKERLALAQWLALPVRHQQEKGIEIWWAGDDGEWSDGQSIRWPSDATLPIGTGSAVPLDRLPHWNGHKIKRLRVVFRLPGWVLVAPPRLFGS
jgi:hypothetical protein